MVGIKDEREELLADFEVDRFQIVRAIDQFGVGLGFRGDLHQRVAMGDDDPAPGKLNPTGAGPAGIMIAGKENGRPELLKEKVSRGNVWFHVVAFLFGIDSAPQIGEVPIIPEMNSDCRLVILAELEEAIGSRAVNQRAVIIAYCHKSLHGDSNSKPQLLQRNLTPPRNVNTRLPHPLPQYLGMLTSLVATDGWFSVVEQLTDETLVLLFF